MSDRLAAAVEELAAAIRAEVRLELEAAPATTERLIGTGEAAKALGIGRTALYQELQSGRLPSLTVRRRRMISVGALEAYIAERSSAGRLS
jgi:excisionase family DNA binding protein